MIELLILYILNMRDRTVYSLRRDIIERFGAFTKPSLGTIYPALKRLLNKGAVKVEQRYSEGGKKSTYYSVEPSAKKIFKEYFTEEISENPTIFHNQLSARLLTISMLEKSERDEFLDNLLKKIELKKVDIEKTVNNKYIEYDETQKAVLSEALSAVESLEKTVQRLKTY